MRTGLPGLSVFLAVLAAAAGAAAQKSAEESASTLRPAEGLEVTLWASEPMVVNPTNMDIDSRGRVWVTEGLNYRFFRNSRFQRQPGADRVKILEDTDGDGKADKVTVFAEDIYPVPMGIAIAENWDGGTYRGCRVFVGNSPDLLVLEDTDGDDKADKRYPLLSGFGGIDHDHGVHGFCLGPDGKLYFTQGDGGYQARPGDKVIGGATFNVQDPSGRRLQSNQLGTVLRSNLDGTDLQRLAYRLRNDYECAVDSFGNVFASDNDDDGNRGSRMVWVMDAGSYGYRTSSRHWGEELPGNVPKLAGTGNGSPAGILVYEGDLLDAKYHGGVIQVDAGTRQLNFHPLKRHGAGFRSDYEVLLGGEDPWFRPIDACVAPDGSIYVADWYDGGVGGHAFQDQTTGRIQHLKPPQSSLKKPMPDFRTADGLIAALASPNLATRFVARTELSKKPAAFREALVQLFATGGRPHVSEGHHQNRLRNLLRGRALFVLADLAGTGPGDVALGLTDSHARIRECALRILVRDCRWEAVIEPEGANRVPPRAAGVLEQVLPLAQDADAGVRRELLLGIRNVETAKVRDALVALVLAWDGQDRFYLEALHLALRDREGDFLESLFGTLAQRALAEGWSDDQVALPPYFPTATNESFLRIDDALPPANPASKLIGVAWVLGRAEGLAALRRILDRNTSSWIREGAGMVLDRIDDPRTVELLVDWFESQDEPNQRREVLRILARKLAAWKSGNYPHERVSKVFDTALASAELRVDAIRALAGGRSGPRYADRLMSFAEEDGGDLQVRAAAISTLGRIGHEPARALVGWLLETAKGSGHAGPLAVAALSASSAFRGKEALATLEGIVTQPDYPLDFRRQAVRDMSQTSEGAGRLIELAKSKRLADELRTEAAFLLHNHSDRRIAQAAHDVLVLGKGAGGSRLRSPNEVLALTGDPAKGKQVFERDASDACIRCHRVQGIGEWVGPDLSSIGTKYARPELLYHLLDPSGAVGYNYVAHSLALADGRTLVGLITDESADLIVLKTATGDRLVIRTGDIEARQPQHKSLMPEELANSLTAQDLADILGYLETLRQPVATVGEYHLHGPVPAQGDTTPPATGDPGWRRVSTSRDDFLDISGLLGTREGQCLFAKFPVQSPGPQGARVILRSPGRLALWHNGRAVHLAGPRTVGRTVLWESFLHLAGTNELVIRIASGPIDNGLVTSIISHRNLRLDIGSATQDAAATR